jgi:predicted permease
MKFLLTSRKFIALIIGIILIFVMAFFPNFPGDQVSDQTTNVVVLVMTFILGTAFDPGQKAADPLAKLKTVFLNPKFYAAAIGIVMAIVKQFSPSFPLDEAQVLNITILLVSYITGVSLKAAIYPIPPA